MKKIALIGAGKMGGFIARQLPPSELIIIDQDWRKAGQLASSLGAKAASSMAEAGPADLVVMALPGPAVDRVAAELAPLLSAGALIINVATGETVGQGIKAAFPALCFIEAKIIGNAFFMEMGGRSIMVVDSPGQARLKQLRLIFPGFTEVMAGDVDMVPAVNELATGEAVKIGVKLCRRLESMGAPESWRDIIIESVCAGTLAAYARRELGPFALAMAEKALAGEDQPELGD